MLRTCISTFGRSPRSPPQPPRRPQLGRLRAQGGHHDQARRHRLSQTVPRALRLVRGRDERGPDRWGGLERMVENPRVDEQKEFCKVIDLGYGHMMACGGFGGHILAPKKNFG